MSVYSMTGYASVQHSTPVVDGETPASTAPALTATELAFVTQAIEAGLFDLRVGQLGAERASHTAVRSYAALLVNDQTTMNRNLQQLARRLGVPVPATMKAKPFFTA